VAPPGFGVRRVVRARAHCSAASVSRQSRPAGSPSLYSIPAIACWLTTSAATIHADRGTTPQGATPSTARIPSVTSPPGVPPRSCHTRPGPGGETTRRFSTVRPHAPSAPHHRR